DIDLAAADDSSLSLADLLPDATPRAAESGTDEAVDETEEDAQVAQALLTPEVSSFGSTVRVNFPFANDTAAAVFRRGDVLWMVFDTDTQIQPPGESSALEQIADSFDVI